METTGPEESHCPLEREGPLRGCPELGLAWGTLWDILHSVTLRSVSPSTMAEKGLETLSRNSTFPPPVEREDEGKR